MQTMALAAVVAMFLIITVRDLVARRIGAGDAWLWLALASAAATLLAFPNVAGVVARVLGFQVASNLIFTIAILALAWLVRRQAVRMSQWQNKVQDLVQELALLTAQNSDRSD